MSNTQLERRGHCLNSTLYLKNLISMNRKTSMHQQRDGAAKKVTSRSGLVLSSLWTRSARSSGPAPSHRGTALHSQWHLF